MNRRERLVLQMEALSWGDPWHGPSVASLLAKVDAATAGRRPLPTAHSIWEIVLHMNAWAREARRRLDGAPLGAPREGDWPEVGATDPDAWSRCVADYREARGELCMAVRNLSEAALDSTVGVQREPSLGTGVSVGEMLQGVALHDAYHSGQMALLLKAPES